MLSPTQALDGAIAKLPTGWAYPRDRDSRMAALVTPLAQEHVLFEQRAEAMLPEAPSPREAEALLTDFERVLGPDTCVAAASSTASQRQAAAYARWTAMGGASIAGLIALAASYGVAITITELRRNCCGVLRCGRPLRTHPQQFVWLVGLPATTVIKFRTGRSKAGQPLGKVAVNTVIECVIRRAAPAHTVPVFRYAVPAGTAARWGVPLGTGSVWS